MHLLTPNKPVYPPSIEIIMVEIVFEDRLKKHDAWIKRDNGAVDIENRAVGKPDHARRGDTAGNHQEQVRNRQTKAQQNPIRRNTPRYCALRGP